MVLSLCITGHWFYQYKRTMVLSALVVCIMVLSMCKIKPWFYQDYNRTIVLSVLVGCTIEPWFYLCW